MQRLFGAFCMQMGVLEDCDVVVENLKLLVSHNLKDP